MKFCINITLLILLVAVCSCNKNNHNNQAVLQDEVVMQDVYTCSMHPEIKMDKPGKCPICGMDLVKKRIGIPVETKTLETLLKPTNTFVVSAIPVTTLQQKELPVEMEALGTIAYDTRQTGSIAARVSGRIEKLYIHFRYQKISKGQKILDLYSPELMTAQQNLLFLIKNDPANTGFIQSAKQKLLLLGMNGQQLQQVIRTGNPSGSISVYSNYNGHIHEAAGNAVMGASQGSMNDLSLITEELLVKEGMYLQKGQTVFTVYNPDLAWAVLNIYAENQAMVKAGNRVTIIPETAPQKDFNGTVDFVEPFYRKNSKTVTVRVYFNNSVLKIPIGSQVRATLAGTVQEANWLLKDAVVSLGLDKVVFLKTGGGFQARKVHTGMMNKNQIQILDGIRLTDSVAVNAQYLMDSESFIKIKD